MALARYQFTVVDNAGSVLPAASVEVRAETSGAPLASLFSDRDGAVGIGNPFAADSDGFAAFHVVGGAYRVTASLGGFSRTWRYVGIGTAQEIDNDLIVLKDVNGDLTDIRNFSLTGYIDFHEIPDASPEEPEAPAANVGRVYAADSDGTTVMRMKDAAGNDVALSHFRYGATGDVVRTQLAKLQERRSVTDFGALGDGSTDDSAAIQAALDAGRGIVFFPTGTFMASELSWPSEVAILGEQRDKTVLKLVNGANSYLLASKRYVDNSADLFPDGQNSLRDITLDGNKANNTSGSCLILRSYNAQIYSSIFQNAADHGIIQTCRTANGGNPQNAAECVYKENRVHLNEKHGMWFKDDGEGKIADAWLVDNWIHENGTDGYVQVNIERGAGFHIHSNQLYSDYQGNIIINEASGTAFTGNNLELNTLKGGTGETYKNMEIGLGLGGGANLGITMLGNFFHTFLSDVATNTYRHVDFTGSGDAAIIDGNVFRGPTGGWTNGAAIERTAVAAIIGTVGARNFFQNFTAAQRGQGYYDLSRHVVITSGSGVTAQTLASIQPDAVAGPIIDLDRQSASPAGGDNIGMIRFRGRDSGGGSDDYAYLVGIINDATAASEDGQLNIRGRTAGADVLFVAFGGVGINLGTVGIIAGTGSPNGVLTAAKGSLFLRTDASGTADRMYINTNGGTAWTNFTTAA